MKKILIGDTGEMRGEFWAESTTLIKAKEQVLKSPTVSSPRAGNMGCSELTEKTVGQTALIGPQTLYKEDWRAMKENRQARGLSKGESSAPKECSSGSFFPPLNSLYCQQRSTCRGPHRVPEAWGNVDIKYIQHSLAMSGSQPVGNDHLRHDCKLNYPMSLFKCTKKDGGTNLWLR